MWVLGQNQQQCLGRVTSKIVWSLFFRNLFSFLLYIKHIVKEMRLGSLSAELDAITREFDYGIVPGSATVFVKDEVNGIGRLDLTLLEGVMIVLEVTDEGYKVNWNSC